MVDPNFLAVIREQIKDFKIPVIEIKSLKIKSEAGSGGQAKVYKGEYDGKPVAVKVITDIDIKCIVHEIAIQSKLDHPNIPKFYGMVIDSEFVAYVSEYVNGRTLDEFTVTQFSMDQKIFVLKCISDSLTFLHKQKFVHRDLKPENVMLTEDLSKVFLIDFGIAKVLGNPNKKDKEKENKDGKDKKEYIFTRAKGTINYISPETLEAEMVNDDDQIISEVTIECDVWSFGCLISYLFSGYVPWTPKYKDDAIIIQKVLTAKKPFPIPDSIKDERILKILAMSLVIDKKKRASMEEINTVIKNF